MLAAADTEKQYTGNGVSTAYALPAEIQLATDFEAQIDGVVTTAYTLTGLGSDTGVTCTFDSPPANGARIVLRRNAPYDRTLVQYAFGDFNPDTLNGDIDRAVMLVQQLATLAKRVVRGPVGDLTLGLDLDPEASKLLAWSSDARSLVNVDVADVSPASLIFTAIGQALAVAADAAAGRTAIGAMSQADVDATIAALTLPRNLLINGGMLIDQRNEGAAINLTAASGALVVDRWFARSMSAASGTLTAQRVFSGTITDPPYSVRLLRSAGTYAGSLCIEQLLRPGSGGNPRPAGKTITVTALVRKGSAFSGSDARLSVISGTGTQGHAALVAGTWGGVTTVGSVTIPAASLTTAYQSITLTVTLPANANQYAVRLEAVTFSGAGAANDYLEFTEAQVSYGSVAPSFLREDFAEARARCYPFYEKSYDVGVAPGSVSDAGALLFRAVGTGGILETMGARFRAPKSTGAPLTVTIYSPGTGTASRIRNTTAAADVVVSTLSNQSAEATGWVTIAAAIAANLYSAHWTADGEMY